jgi:hypothetical protein
VPTLPWTNTIRGPAPAVSTWNPATGGTIKE